MASRHAGSKSRHRRELTKKALLDLEITERAFNKLTKRGVDEQKLLSLLAKIIHTSDEVLSLVEGMTDRNVRALPDRICSWSDVIEKVNASPRLSPDRLPERTKRDPKYLPEPLNWTMTPERAEFVAKQFHMLPKVLRYYSRHLRAWIQFFHPTGARRRELGISGLRLQTLLTLQLLKLVRDSAGRPHYGEIATLLEAAYKASGKPKTISAEDLNKLEKNNPYLQSLLCPELYT